MYFQSGGGEVVTKMGPDVIRYVFVVTHHLMMINSFENQFRCYDVQVIRANLKSLVGGRNFDEVHHGLRPSGLTIRFVVVQVSFVFSFRSPLPHQFINNLILNTLSGSSRVNPDMAISDFSDVENPSVYVKRRVRRGYVYIFRFHEYFTAS